MLILTLTKINKCCKKYCSFLHSQKKVTKAVTGVVPFQKVNVCPF